MNIQFFKDKEDKLDPLTHLYTRDVIFSYMEHLSKSNTPFTYAILDVDNFKSINDTYGHIKGDFFLEEISKHLSKIIEDKGVIGRYGGDEFIFVFENITDYDDVWQLGYDILKSSCRLNDPELKNLSYSYTMGFSRFPIDTEKYEELLELADKALYRGKMKGRNCFIIYLAEKHKNIDLKSEREKTFSSMYLHTKVYNMLTADDPLEKNIKSTIDFLGNYYMIDHLCIETGEGLSFEYNHPLNTMKDFTPLGMDVISSHLNSQTGYFHENCVSSSRHKGRSKLYKRFEESKITATVICEIKACQKLYGYLRADMVMSDIGRIWQDDNINIFLEFSHDLALLYKALDK